MRNLIQSLDTSPNISILSVVLSLCFGVLFSAHSLHAQQDFYVDTVFLQDQSLLFLAPETNQLSLLKVGSDRNDNVQVLSNQGLLAPVAQNLKPDSHYAFMDDLEILDIEVHHNQFFYLAPTYLFSNAWAGKHLIEHSLTDAHEMAINDQFDALVIGKQGIQYIVDNTLAWDAAMTGNIELLDVAYDSSQACFWLISSEGLHRFNPQSAEINLLLPHEGMTSLLVPDHDVHILVGSTKGLLVLDRATGTLLKQRQDLPSIDISCLTEIGDQVWVGTSHGAYRIKSDEHVDYYASRRWLVDDEVQDIGEGPNGSALILTRLGLSQITYTPMTLLDKAMHFERQVRQRHIRHGFSSSQFTMSTPGDLSTGSVVDSDNDGLWTSMYLASQLFRYEVTKSDIAYQNALEAFEAMERLNTINPIEGFLARSYERRSYAKHDLDAWHKAENEYWDWKGTTSSDEAIGHYLAFSLLAEISPDSEIKERAINLIRDMTDHILEHDLYLVDIDGKPTRWARWNPDYVNGFPEGVGDRKLNSSNITGFLQTAYHFTKDEKYRDAAFELFEEHGYLKNLMKPMEEIGNHKSDSLSALLSEHWNHSDDEMYFLSYWYLYHYAFNPDLKEQYRETIKNHWNIERPEKDALWNFCYAMTGASEFDLEESIWYLREFPMDLIEYTITNSHRLDIKKLPPNFRNQTTTEVLPPDEKPIYKHNTNTFIIDRKGGARSEASGDIYLLPYWFGRYLGVIGKKE